MNSTPSSLINNYVAPTGELVAERIAAANSTRSEACVYEGPIWINDALYFSDFTFDPGFPSRIQKLDATGLTTFIEDSGSNGLAQGDLVAATHKYKGLAIFNLATKKCRLIAREYNGNVFNSPNDIVIAKDGTIYFTDPDFQKNAAQGAELIITSRGNNMNLTNSANNSREIQDNLVNEKKIEKGYTPSDITLSHKEAKAGSPYDNSGEEDPGAALELLITKIDSDDH